MKKDLVLEWVTEKWNKWYDQKNDEVSLPNIQGQRYVLGSEYPGEREGEEFFFCRNEGILVDSTQFVIRVDNQGQYWIQSETTKFKTFVNSERLLMEPRLLRIGDIVFLEDSQIRDGYARYGHPIFLVKKWIGSSSGLEVEGFEGAGSDSEACKATIEPDLLYSDGAESPLDNNLERIVPALSGLEIEGAGSGSDSEASKAMKELDLVDGSATADSPLHNNLILSEIMSYLPVKDLKNARLVCKKWKEEASKPLEKKGKVSFSFAGYLSPYNSTRVFRYIHDMRDMKMRNLHISLYTWRNYQNKLFSSPGEPGEKVMDDLQKLLNSSHNFSTLILEADIAEESGFHPFATVFQELGEKLVELKLEIRHILIPAAMPSFPLMSNLNKFTSEEYGGADPRWVSHIVPQISHNLEHFTCSFHTADPYLQEFLKHPTPNLKGIALKDEASVKSLSALLELKTPLTLLETNYPSHPFRRQLLESLLLKNSKSLQTLVIRNESSYFFNYYEGPEISFPSLPKLKELVVEYDRGTRIGWGNETSLDYEAHFPSLRKLTVRPRQPWREDDHVFNAFFPEEGELRCETLKEVWTPVLQDPEFSCDSDRLYMSLESFQPRMNKIKRMFPNAGKINFSQ